MAEAVVAGNQFDIGIALQTNRGQVIDDAQYRFPVTGGGLDAAKVINVLDETTENRVPNTSYVGAVNVDGAPAVAARPEYLGLLLYGIFGDHAVAGAADPWTHTFTLAAGQPYFNLWKRIGPVASGGDYEQYIDCKLVALQLASSAEGIIVATPTFMGLRVRHKDAASVAVAITAHDILFMHHHGGGNMLSEGAAVSSITAFNLTMGGNATRIRGTSLYGSHVAEQRRDLSIVTTQLVDWELRRRIMYGAADPADAAEPSGAVLELGSPGLDYKFTIPGQANERSLRIQAPRTQVSHDPINPNTGGDPLTMQLTHRLFQPSGGVSAITATLLNGVADYPAIAP